MFANVTWNDLYSLLRHSTTDRPIVNPLSKVSIAIITLLRVQIVQSASNFFLRWLQLRSSHAFSSCYCNASWRNEKMATFETQPITDARQCLTAPPPSGCSWIKCGKIFDAGPPTSHVLISGVTEPNLTKMSHKVENWWSIKTLKSEFQHSNSFSNASMTNGRRSSNWSWVAAQFPFVSLFPTKTTGPIFTNFLQDIVALVALLNNAYTRH